MEVIATVIEQGAGAAAPSTPTAPGTPTTPTTPTSTSSAGAGTPVHNGTVVTFTTTIGRVEPAEARTHNGQARVTFIANGQSGTATITAFSGGASGKLENLKVGSAGADHLLLTASPQALACSGGSSTVSARVEDVSGVGLAAVPVTFTTTKGTVNPGTVTTDSNGTAATTLTTSQEATVTANAAGKTATATVTLSPRTGITITAPTGQISALTPTSFTVGVAGTANISNVRIDFGDSTGQDLGPITGSVTVPHTYTREGTYSVSATASDAAGCSERVTTGIAILPAQPPSVTISFTPSSARVFDPVIVRATVSGNTSAIIGYDWNFGPGAVPETRTTTGPSLTVTWTTATPPTKGVTVTVRQAAGPSADGFGSILITPNTPLQKRE
jgi:hypothetical protein